MSKQSNFNYKGIVTFQVTIRFGLGFMRFLSAILNFVGLFSLYQIDCNFVYEFF